MKLRVGTSGYSYAAWKGSFYPERLPAKAMLAYYAQHFATVEINATFYRMPTAAMLDGWARQVPESFELVLKAPRRLSHDKAWSDSRVDFDHFVDVARTLGGRAGPLLFQIPPFAKKDHERLARLLSYVPADVKLAFEVRHASWLDADIFRLLGDHDAALCVSDDDAEKLPNARQLPEVASWGYLRLRKTDYSDAELAAWLGQIQARAWSQAYVFFKHEDTGSAPLFAKRFLALAASEVVAGSTRDPRQAGEQ